MPNINYGSLNPDVITDVSLAYVSSRKDVAEMSPEDFAQKFIETYKQIQKWSDSNKDKHNAEIQEAERLKQEQLKRALR